MDLSSELLSRLIMETNVFRNVFLKILEKTQMQKKACLSQDCRPSPPWKAGGHSPCTGLLREHLSAGAVPGAQPHAQDGRMGLARDVPALPRPGLGRPCAGSPLLVSLSFRSPGRFCVLHESRRPPRGGPGGFLQPLAPRVDRRLEGVRGLPRLGHSSWGPPTPRDEDALPRRQARQLATEPERC